MSDSEVSRRQFFVKLGVALNGLAAVALATPVIGYLLGPIFRAKDGGYRKWISLGELDDFPEGQTRLAKYKNPISNAWDGETDNIPCWVRRTQGEFFRCSPSTAHILDARYAGSRSRDCSCAPVMAECTTRTVRELQVHRSAGSLNINTKLKVVT